MSARVFDQWEARHMPTVITPAEGRKKQLWYRGIGSSKRLLFGHFWYEEEIGFWKFGEKICKSAKKKKNTHSAFFKKEEDD